jgi:tetratricopeptide (TPR) repeat protein
MFLLYMIMFAHAFPKRELFVAIGIEVFLFIGIAISRLFRSKSQGGKAKHAVLFELASGGKSKLVRKIYESCAVTLWITAALIISFDFAAFSSAFCGNFENSQRLYTAVPVSIALGLHPAATLEMLSGAYVEAKNHAQAEHLYATIEKIRLQIYGADHEMMVALYTDFGDLYCKQMQFEKAASYYMRAIDLSKRINGPSGYGRPLTGLANTLRDRGRDAEAGKTYSEALSMRQKLLWCRQ